MQVIQHYIQVSIHAYVCSNHKKKLYVTCSTHLIAQRESDRLKIRLDIWEKRRTASQFLRLLGLRKSSGCWIAWRNLSRVFNRILTRDFDRSFPFNFQSIRWFSLVYADYSAVVVVYVCAELFETFYNFFQKNMAGRQFRIYLRYLSIYRLLLPMAPSSKKRQIILKPDVTYPLSGEVFEPAEQ